MKYCNKCKIDISGTLHYCPLCQNELLQKNTEKEEALFPNSYNLYTSNHLLLRILGFISITIAIISVIINLMFPSTLWWSLIVVITTGCVWLSLAAAISKHRNLLRYLLYQSLIICLFAAFLDYLTGSKGWSVDLVLPTTFSLAMIVMYLLSKILHLQTGDYMIYLLLDALFGILPAFILLTRPLHSRIPSIICVAISLISVASLIIFEGRNIFQELDRRLHI